MSTARVYDFVIVGTGFSGLGAAIHAQRRGRSYVVLEKASSVGGTWRENHYPGCACDVPSHFYSFSFAPNPRWSRFYSPQPEIRAYLDRCADDFGVRPHIRFDQRVTSARFDEPNAVWRVETATGETFVGKYLVLGIGALHEPSTPALPGLSSFRGRVFHSANWDHAFDAEGKTVATVGTGASAIQFIPQLAKRAKQLRVFQRTPAWVMPKLDRAVSASAQETFAKHPAAQRAIRWGIFGLMEALTIGFVQRPEMLRFLERSARRHIARHITDLALRAKLTPDYHVGCKRVLVSNDYYPALARDNVEVITDAIDAITSTGIVTRDGSVRDVDAIVFGTGFAVTERLTPLAVFGRDGIDLNAAWQNGAEAHLGTMVTGFPNAFSLMGPNTGLGSGSMVFMIEAQIEYMMKTIALTEKRSEAIVDVKSSAQARYNRDLQTRLANTVWASGCKSWYLDKNGRNSTLWPGLTTEFWLRTRWPNANDFLFGKQREMATNAPSRTGFFEPGWTTAGATSR